jgi:DNA-binding transcriptional LysR family regulator
VGIFLPARAALTAALDFHQALGAAAPYESSPELEYLHLFSMDWSLVTRPRQRRGWECRPLVRKPTLSLADLTDLPLILFERGSTGRAHVVDAFHGESLSPRVEMETTNTEIIVRMVEAGLGVSIVPLMPSGVVTRGHKVAARSLGKLIRPIHSGILVRRGEALPLAGRAFTQFLAPAARADAGRRSRGCLWRSFRHVPGSPARVGGFPP